MNPKARDVLHTLPCLVRSVFVLARYVDAAGANVPSSLSFPSAAAMAYTSVDGYEELHLFFSLAWFDIGSWAWIHFVVEWGTKGVFQVLLKCIYGVFCCCCALTFCACCVLYGKNVDARAREQQGRSGEPFCATKY